MTTDLATRTEAASVMQLFERAFEKGGATPDALAQLVALKEQVDRRNAELEFAAAMQEFQHRCPSVQRTSTAEIATKSGARFKYAFADFEEIMDTVRPHLSALGLSVTFDSAVDGKMLTCTATLRHVNGHSITSSFTLPTDSSSAMSDQQRYGAALTFAKRQVITSVLGLSLTDPVAPGDEASPEKLTEEQQANLLALCDETASDKAKFLAFAGAGRFADIRATDYDRLVKALERKRG